MVLTLLATIAYPQIATTNSDQESTQTEDSAALDKASQDITQRDIAQRDIAQRDIAQQAITAQNIRKQLLENQRNILLLYKEKQFFINELAGQQANQATDSGDSSDQALQSLIIETIDSIAVADTLIASSKALVSEQRLTLTTLERREPPTALDIALNKALNSNLPELAKNLSNNEGARKEISRLRALLKQQARLGINTPSTHNSVSHAGEQHLAEDEFLRLLSLFSSGTVGEKEDKTIKITGLAENQPFTEEEILSYLGHDQYHMETIVYSGKMTFTVDGRPWQLYVSPEEDQSTYVIIYDIADATEARLVMFNKSLLLE